MQLVPNDIPAPRLLSSAALEHLPTSAPAPATSGELKRSGLFGGNGLAIFVGLAVAAMLLFSASRFFAWREAKLRGDAEPPRLLDVATRNLSTSPDAIVPPEPVFVMIEPAQVNVTAISIGLPRLAVINGRSVAEGDFLTIRTPSSANVNVRLQVKRIADGHIELAHGQQTLIARIRIAPLNQPQR